MKVGVLMNVYNESEWVKCAIDSVIDWCDEMVIIEGAYGIAMKAGAPARSNDGTLDILKTYSVNPKVKVVHANERDEAPQLQIGLEILKEKKVDWYLLVDGDEVWQKKDLAVIKSKMIQGEKQGIYQYRVHFNNFINSFDQYYPAVMQRVFKLTPKAKSIGQNGVYYPELHEDYPDQVWNQTNSFRSIIPDIIKCFHYTEIKSADRWLLKKRYLKVRDGNPRFDSWYVNENGFHNDEKGIFKFKGTHPDIVKQSRLYKLWEQDPELLRKELFGNV